MTRLDMRTIVRRSSLVLLPCAAVMLAPTIAAAEVKQSQEIIHRTLTAPAGQAEAGGSLIFTIIPDTDVATAVDITGAFGITDQVDVRVGYAFAVSPKVQAKGALGAELGIGFMDTGNLALAGRVGLGYSLAASAALPLEAGVTFRFKFNDQVALYSPFPQLSIALEEEMGARPIQALLPIAIGFQATPQIFAAIKTNIATLKIKDSANSFIFKDTTELKANLFFSPSNAIDLGAGLGWGDIINAPDTLDISLTAILYL